MALNRREMVAGAGAFASLAALPACTRSARQTASSPAADTAATRMLAEVAEDLLAEYPENATALGLDKEARGGLKSRLTDRSPAGQRRIAANTAARLAKLRRIDRTALSPSVATGLAVVQTAHETALEGFRFPYGDVVTLNQQYSYRNAPYVVTQNTGAFVEIPDFLDSNHKVESAADAAAYLQRVEAYAAVLDGETERLRASAGAGVIAPSFLLDKALGQMRSARAEPLDRWGLVTSIEKRTATIPGDWGRRAARIVAARVTPAMDRQIAELARHRARADARAGVWKLPQGDAYYAWALRASTTTRLTPDEVFSHGQEELRSLQARMDPLLRAQGLTQGSVGQRMTALGNNPQHLFPNTDAGRQQILDYINGKVVDIKARMPRAFATLVPGNLVVRRVPVAIEAGAPGGYAAAGTIDGSVPGMYYINLRDTGIWPRYALPTLTYHEGIPGHIWQGEYTYKLPLVRSLLAFNAYSEGWALYAEQLADELGVYEGDPLGQLGYLQSLAFRACRLVVDTGLHAKRWTRERAVAFFVEENGSNPLEVASEVDRYCSWAGQACGYKVGHSEIVRQRGLAQTALGPKYDLRDFNDVVVKGGNVPLDVLALNVAEYVAGPKG